MPFPPECFIVGAQRAGTTTLSAMLDQHPGIILSNPKEPDFFSVNWERGLDWYRSCFRSTDGKLLDASPNYTMAVRPPGAGDFPDTVPRRISQVSPGAKFIYLVRDPAERCYSAYWHEVRAGRETRQLRQAVNEEAYYVTASYYYSQLKPFLLYFPLDRFQFIRFEDLAKDPSRVARQCAEFFGVERSGFTFATGRPRNQAFVYNWLGGTLRYLIGEDRLKILSEAASNALPYSLHPYARRIISRAIPSMSSVDRQLLTQQFAGEARAFEELSGVNVVSVRADQPGLPP